MGVFHFHAVFDAQHALLDLVQLSAMCVLEDQGLAHAQRLAVHLEHLLTLIILDPEVIADGNHLLAHLVVVAATARTPIWRSSWRSSRLFRIVLLL